MNGSKAVRPLERTYAASLTRCAGTWLATPPTAEEEAEIAQASSVLNQRRAAIAQQFHADPQAADALSIMLFRQPEFAALTLEAWVVEEALAQVGEPPMGEGEEAENDFADYLRNAVLSIAHAKPRRALAAQLRRFLPRYVAAEEWQSAAAIDYNALRTSLGNEVSPFLAQIMLAGLAAYYEERDED